MSLKKERNRDVVIERKYYIFVLVIALAFYVLNNHFKYQFTGDILGPFFRYHFNDYLAGWVFLSYVNFVLSFSKYPQANNLVSVLFYALLCSLAWEFVLPLLDTKSTADVLDVIAYFMGALSYYFTFKFISKLKLP